MSKVSRFSLESNKFIEEDIPYEVTVIEDDLKSDITCACCGNTFKYGSSFVSNLIRTPFGLGVCICESCKLKEREIIRQKNDEGIKIPPGKSLSFDSKSHYKAFESFLPYIEKGSIIDVKLHHRIPIEDEYTDIDGNMHASSYMYSPMTFKRPKEDRLYACVDKIDDHKLLLKSKCNLDIVFVELDETDVV